MKNFKFTYILLIFTFVIFGCRQTKNVPDGRYLVQKNKIKSVGDKLSEDDLETIIRQPENFRTFGLKLKLQAFNLVDSTRVAEKRIRLNEKIDRTNDKRRKKEKRINERRIERSQKKNQDFYTKKTISLKDTLIPKLFLREWLKYKYGEKPVVFDSTSFEKTIEQHGNYLRKKGYYYGSTSGEVRFKPKRKKAIVTYHLITGKQYTIDSVYIVMDTLKTSNYNPDLGPAYFRYVQQGYLESLVGKPFDRDMLDDYRGLLARRYRDDAFYGFSPSHILYVADTNFTTMNVSLGIQFLNRSVHSPNNPDSLIQIKHQTTFIRNVYFHISDTTFFQGNFKETMISMGLKPFEGQFANTLDTLYYAEIRDKKTDSLEKSRIATFYFNEKIFVDPSVIESQNYLEEGNYYKEYYVDRSYTRLAQLGLFTTIKPQIEEVFGTNEVDVHYYLAPAKKQGFELKPRASNSNGYFGVSASINYVNKNLFGGAEKMTISLTGGIESQPPVFDPSLQNSEGQNLEGSFNTLELGPNIVFDLPGLFPTRLTALSKRHRPRTIISAAYQFQKRQEFTRSTFQANYLWKMYPSKTQVFQYGFPGLSVVKFVSILPEENFQNQLNILNDLFLRNAYSDQLIWQDWKFIFEFNNKDQDKNKRKSASQIYYNGSFDPAGNMVSLFKDFQELDAEGRHLLFGVAYSQFLRIDNDFIVSKPIDKKSSAHFRLLAGGGIPNGNKQTSLPFDYSFFAGGSNDNRGWRARSLGPGSYKYMLDTNRTLTQIGDIRLGASAEYRFSLGPTLKGAAFVDAGNIWTFNEDVNRPGSQFSSSWYREIAYSAGVGVRLDLDFFIVRIDLGVPLNNVSVAKDSRWIFQSRDALNEELLNAYGLNDLTRLRSEGKIPRPFRPEFHFGIGYPF